jgi:hypothetical protein
MNILRIWAEIKNETYQPIVCSDDEIFDTSLNIEKETEMKAVKEVEKRMLRIS